MLVFGLFIQSALKTVDYLISLKTLEMSAQKCAQRNVVTSRIETIIEGRAFSLGMFFCVVGFVLFKRLYRDIGDIFIFLVFLGTAISVYHNFRIIRKDPIFIAFFFSLFIPIFSWINSKVQIPEFAREHPSPLLFYDFFFFWFIAYWTKGENWRIAVILAAYCLTVIGIYITHSDSFFDELMLGLQGRRVDFNVVNAQYTSLFAGFGLISSAFLYVVKTGFSKNLETTRKVAALGLSAFFIVVIIITQSRQVWLALLVCLFCAPLVNRLIFGSRVKAGTLVTAYVVLALITFGAANIETVHKRLEAESSSLIRIANLDLDSLQAAGSVGLRIHLWSEALVWISERPILGSGEEARRTVIQESSTLPNAVRTTFTHLHNSHLETLLSFGVIGAALVYFLICWPVIYTTMLSAAAHRRTWTAFSFIVLIFWLTVNCFESYFYSSNGIFVFAVFYGIIYSFRFPHHIKDQQLRPE